ncbi:MAG: CheR family methyltransferase, partial [Aestuariivirga sp.]
VILSGTGADGSAGAAAIKAKGGLVIAQEPSEAGYDGMPRSAIAAGVVDHVFAVAKIPGALKSPKLKPAPPAKAASAAPPAVAPGWLHEIIELLRARTAHDFTLYKQGTLQRRVERRMALAGIKSGETERYLDMLRNDVTEIETLAKDLLINVTSFFRDLKAFHVLGDTIISSLVRNQKPGQPLRVWVAGCSTGEEAYSLAMLFREHIAASKRNVQLQVFASDVDRDAVASAREGRYADSIEADVSPDRLARFFSRDDDGYKVSAELRATVIFTVHDVIADPPFSRLDLVSCRNLLIYLGPEAQAKVISLFHFALRDGGLLMLGSAETAGGIDGRFEMVCKPERIYRNLGRGRAGDISFAAGDAVRPAALAGPGVLSVRPVALAELCRRLVLNGYAPAAVLINRKFECIYSMGPTDRYLRVAPGHPTHDVLAMAPQGVRAKLKFAIQQAIDGKGRIAVTGCRTRREGKDVEFSIEVQAVPSDDLFLICFVDAPKSEPKRGRANRPQELDRVAELEHELDAVRLELQGAVRDLEISGEEQKAIYEEALSVNEEYQSTNEELLTSKEELQSLNEELTALNSQLQETLERQRSTSDDLQNILYSTDVATLFLDRDLGIRFFTPATKSLFHVIPGDIGRPLADLNSLSADADLSADAQAVLSSLAPIEREVETGSGVWFLRRISPYRTHSDNVEGVVITFTDISERKRIRKAMEESRLHAEQANAGKSRFLAMASHDLRQPLQTLALLQGLLAREVEGEKAQKLVVRLDETLGAMTGMLNTLLDINQIEAGNVQPQFDRFNINDVLTHLRDEYAYPAQAQGLTLHVPPCNIVVYSDPRLLEQMIRNLLSNAIKYTPRGKVLLGCRRRAGVVSIEIWDSGIGIADSEMQAIFDEYHQIGNPERARSRGLGLGLSIVQRLAKLLGHEVSVRSKPGKGSVFAIAVALPPEEAAPQRILRADNKGIGLAEPVRRSGAVLVVEDDPDMRVLLELLLKDEGHHVTVAMDGPAALALAVSGAIKPDIVLTDFNLPGAFTGLQLAAQLRETFHAALPVIILTGDISTGTLRDIALQKCVQLNKPVKLAELTKAVQRLLPLAAAKARTIALTSETPRKPVVFVVDDDTNVRETIGAVLEGEGWEVKPFSTCEAFLAVYRPDDDACLLVDAYLPGMGGLELLEKLRDTGHGLPALMITGNSDVAIAVKAMKAGASDFIEKPVKASELVEHVGRALEQARDANKLADWRGAAAKRISGLTARQRQIMGMVLDGHPSKNIAADLHISQRTVENHRASIMLKTGAKSLPALARLALAASNAGGVGCPAFEDTG